MAVIYAGPATQQYMRFTYEFLSLMKLKCIWLSIHFHQGSMNNSHTYIYTQIYVFCLGFYSFCEILANKKLKILLKWGIVMNAYLWVKFTWMVNMQKNYSKQQQQSKQTKNPNKTKARKAI